MPELTIFVPDELLEAVRVRGSGAGMTPEETASLLIRLGLLECDQGHRKNRGSANGVRQESGQG